MWMYGNTTPVGGDADLDQGCTTRPFCYGSFLRQNEWPQPVPNRFDGPFNLPPCRRMNARTADHARAGFFFPREDRLKRLERAARLLIIAFAITTLVRTLRGGDTGVILRR